MPDKNEVEKFLEDTEVDPTKVDVLDAPLTDDPAKEEGVAPAKEDATDDDDKEEAKPRNRRERRLMEKLAAEREAGQFMAGKLAAREEAKTSLSEESDYLKSVERIYGTDTPEALLATDLLKKAIVGARDEAKREAIAEMKAERTREAEAESSALKELDGIVDEIEDEYGVTLTKPQQEAFFTLLEKMSPKRNGEVIEYADPHAVYEVFQEKLKSKAPDSRAKDLSSRSMVKSGAPKESNLDADVHARFLKDNGII